MENIKKIGTHDGQFHADEVLACCMLRNYTKEFKDGEVTRSRDPEIWSKQDILVDVGGVYIPEKYRFDHHQREFNSTFSENHQIRLSSAGLIYKHFGQEIIQNLIQEILSKVQLDIPIEITPESTEIIYQKLYSGFIESVDGIDNGVNQYPQETPKAYSDHTGFSSKIGRFNQKWSLKKTLDDKELFYLAMQEAQKELVSQTTQVLIEWYPGRPFVLEAIKKRFETHPSGQIIRMDRFVPWKDHLYTLEEELNIQDQIKFILFKESEKSSNWRIQAISIKGSFSNRVSLKEEWRGVKEIPKLKEISQIPDIIFVHATGFIGGAGSYESVLKMALLSLQIE